MKFGPAVLGLGLLVAACGAASPPAQTGPEVAAVPSASQTAEPAGGAGASSLENPSARVVDPGGANTNGSAKADLNAIGSAPVLHPSVKLETACVPEPAPTGQLDACGTRGRTSLEVNGATSMLAKSGDCEPQTLARQGMYASLACVRDDFLHAGSECFACRMLGAGWSVRARIPELTAAQSVELQRHLGLDASRPLTSAAAWKRAIEAAKPAQP